MNRTVTSSGLVAIGTHPVRVAGVPSPSSDHDAPASPNRVLSLRWWLCDQDGRVTIAQWPNPALAVWLVAVVVGWTEVLGADRTETLRVVGQGALVAWAVDEVARGASPFRRVLGAVVLVVELVRLFA
jgi:hypothetical protein